MRLTKRTIWTGLAACICGSVLLSPSEAAEPKEKIKGVETSDLLKRPQNYWSVSIAFKDDVTDTPGQQIEILDKTYYSVELKALGLTYASEEGFAQITKAGSDREYLLAGTVLHERTGLFRKQDNYYVIIFEATPSIITDTAEVADGLDDLTLADDHPATQHMLGLFSTTQRDLLSLAKELDVPVEELFSKSSEHSEEARDIVRRALRKIEVTEEIPSSEILSGFIFHMLSRKFAAAEDEADPEPAVSDPDDDAPEMIEAEPEAMTDDSTDDVVMDEVEEDSAPDAAAEVIEPKKAPIAASEDVMEPTTVVPAPKAEPAVEAEEKDEPVVISPAPILAEEIPPKAKVSAPPPAVKTPKVEEPKPRASSKKATSRKKLSDDKHARIPVFALDDSLLDEKPEEPKAQRPKKAKLPVQTIPAPSAENDLFAPVGK